MSAEHPPERLAELQRQFAGHIRDPDTVPPPDGIEDRRMAIYRRLFFNNLSNLFGHNFASARPLIDDSDWKTLIRRFMIDHRPDNPLFPEIAGEFVRFLEQHPEHWTERWPWLGELCHWDWLNTQVRNHPAELRALEVEADGDLLMQRPLVNPTLKLVQYHWNVIDAAPDRPPARTESPVLLAVWRKRSDTPGRLRINAVTGLLIQKLQDNRASSGLECLETLARDLGWSDPAAFCAHGATMLTRLHDQQILLGTVPGA
ncbi:MAG: DUF2063 domain-containing protein [Wenzhouxiangellaceae bacterium]